MRILATALFLVALVASVSFAQVLTVTTAMDTVDANDGLLSLREAVDSANAATGSQEIRFDGTHFHTDSARAIWLRSSLILTDPAGAVIQGAPQFVTLRHDTSLADTVRFDALVLRSGSTTIANLVIRDIKGAGIVIDTVTVGPVVIGPNNKIINTEESGIRIIKSSNSTITGNLVTQSGWWGENDGIAISDTSGAVTVENNQITSNYGSGIGSYGSGPLTVRNNYIARNMYYGVNISGGDGGHLIEENIVVANQWDGISLMGGSENTIRENSIGDSSAVYFVPTLAFSAETPPLAQKKPMRIDAEYPALAQARRIRAQSDEAKLHRIKPERRSLPGTRELPPPQPAPIRTLTADASAAMDHNGNGGSGIALYGTTNTVIEDNLIYGSGNDGIYLSYHYVDEITIVYADGIMIQRNRIERSSNAHIQFYQVGMLTVRNNSMLFSSSGIDGGGGEFAYRSSLQAASPGIRLAAQIPSVIEIVENYITQGGSEGRAIYIYGTESALVERNILDKYYDGAVIYSTVRAVIRMNDFSNIDSYAVEASVSDSLWIYDNKIRNCQSGINASGPYEGQSFADASRNTLTAVEYETFRLFGFQNALVQGNVIDGSSSTGIEIGSLGSAVVSGNSVLNNAGTGLYANSVNSLDLTGNIFRGQYDDSGLEVSEVQRASVSHNKVEDNDGTDFSSVDSLWVWGNSFLSSRGDGLEVYSSRMAHIWNNDFYGHQSDGAYLEYVDSLLFEKNNVSQNMNNGIRLYDNQGPHIRYNTILENGDAGIDSWYDSSFVMEDNFIALNRNGFSIYNTDGTSSLTSNTFFRNLEGSYYSGAIQSLNAKNNYWGDPTGPRDEQDFDGLGLTNHGGQGDDVSESIDWSPFLTEPPYLSESRPAVAEIAPSESPRSGGMTATVRGRQFLPGCILVFGKDTVQNVEYVASNLLAFTIPPGRGGPVDVIIHNMNGKSDTLKWGFRYENNSPFAFSLISPAPNSTIGTANPRFIWNRSVDPDGDAVEYILQYSNTTTFENPVVIEAISDSSFLLPENALTANTTYYWRVVASDTREGYATSAVHQFATGLVLSAETLDQLPASFALDQNYPNPFNPTTTIRFQLPEAAMVTLKIFDLLGREVATLANDQRPAGYYVEQWNGRSNAGVQVSSGVYFYRIDAGNFTQIRRMLFVK
ncbi:MAG: right-handed parallel beta-helix repeat-containing protein [Bacteroidota bacterium]